MNKKIVFLLVLFFIGSNLSAQPDTKKSNTSSGTYTRVSKHKDYGLIVTRLILDMGEGSVINEREITEDLFTINGLETSGKSDVKIKAIAVTDNFGDSADSGRYVTIDLDFGLDTDSSGGISYIVILNKDLGIYHKGAQFLQKGRTIRR